MHGHVAARWTGGAGTRELCRSRDRQSLLCPRFRRTARRAPVYCSNRRCPVSARRSGRDRGWTPHRHDILDMAGEHCMHLEDGIPIGRFEAANRIFMAPCTRHRATIDEVPTPRMVKYYADRASAGLIISEGISPEPRGRGYYFTPGAYNDAQQDGWVPIARAVHARGGRIFGQIMHCGRISDPALQPDGALPIAPSAVQPDPNFRGYTMACPRPKRHHFTPRALETEEIPRLVDSFADAARRLVAAGFDGVELHGASGYLPMQFLSSSSN